MHAVPGRHREGRGADERAALGRGSAERSGPRHERRLDLRPGASGDEPGQDGAEALPRGPMKIEDVARIPADTLLSDELSSEELVDMANLTSAQTGVPGTIFI